MNYFELKGSRGAKIRTARCGANRRAIALPMVALCVLGMMAQVASARDLRPLIDRPDDAARAAIIARLGEAEEKQQALKFDASDLFNMEAKIFGAGRPPVAAEPNRGTPSHDILGLLGFLFGASEASAATTAGPQVIGMWRTLPYLMPINPIHMSMLHTGNILVTAGSENTPSEEGISSKAALWSLQSGTFTVWNNLPWDIFCNGQAALPDGRILIFGGTEQYKGTEGAGANFYGDARATIFDPATTSFPFSQVQSMADGRWYGTATVLGNGGIMAFSGDNDEGDVNNTVEIYRVYQTHQGWSKAVTAPFLPPLYPRQFLLPNGKVFLAAHGWNGIPVVNGQPSYHAQIFDPASQTWTTSAKTFYNYDRAYGGSAVLLPLLPQRGYAPRVLVMGGNARGILAGEATTEIIDLSIATPVWQDAGSMPSGGRLQMNSVLFPNGKVLALNGSVVNEKVSTATLGADMFDSTSNTWTAVAAEAYAHLYHNTVLLLPDGTVISAGSNPTSGTFEPHIELYTPPWLCDANGNLIPLSARPQITSAPSTIGYGAGTFQVQTPNAVGTNLPDVTSVVLMKLGSDTHSFDFEQRMVGLNFVLSSGALTVTCPPNSNIAPPGYYMLFLLNQAGVNSVASFVQVTTVPGSKPPKGTISSPASDLTIQAGQLVNFTGTASDPNPGGSVANLWWLFPGGQPAQSTTPNAGAVLFQYVGQYVASLTAVDNVGLDDPSPPTRMITVQADRLAAPIINTPAARAILSGTAVPVTVTATGTTGTSNTFVFIVGLTVVGTVTTSAPTATFVWDTTQYGNGSHTLILNVTDANGNFGTQREGITVKN